MLIISLCFRPTLVSFSFFFSFRSRPRTCDPEDFTLFLNLLASVAPRDGQNSQAGECSSRCSAVPPSSPSFFPFPLLGRQRGHGGTHAFFSHLQRWARGTVKGLGLTETQLVVSFATSLAFSPLFLFFLSSPPSPTRRR